MERHPYFDLWLHDTPELSAHLGVEIVERVTIHDWPLSCVQLLRLVDGKQMIYKSQLQAASVEPDFYAAFNHDRAGVSYLSRSRLPQAEILGTLENSIVMIFEYIDAPRLEDLHLTEAEIVKHGSRLLSELRQFPADLPVYIDISSQGKWSAFTEDTLTMLLDLISNEKFRMTAPATVQGLADWSKSEAIITTIKAPSALTHGDLGGENVFVTPNGYKIIDWQRPVRGPADLDQANYLFAMGLDPMKYTSHTIVVLNCFLHLRWFVEAQLQWFPEGDYDSQVAELAGLILHPGR
jgi:hypothetical protein